MKDLLKYLKTIPAGSISDKEHLEPLFIQCWEELDGWNSEGMKGYKLQGRMEDVKWDPPILSFSIERHGITVVGSTRATVQEWEINVQKKIALCENVRYRQVYKREPKLNVRQIAQEIVQLIIEGKQDERLKWYKDGSVRIHIGKILPEGSSFKQTLINRRKRFRTAMDELMIDSGWQKIKHNLYSPPNN